MSQITANSYNFEEFIYLGTAINTNNDVSLEISIGLNRQLSSRDLSSVTKLTLYKALILPVLLYGAEAWTLASTNAAALRVLERKVLRKIFSPVRVGNDNRIRTNRELYELFNNMDVAKLINLQRFR